MEVTAGYSIILYFTVQKTNNYRKKINELGTGSSLKTVEIPSKTTWKDSRS